MKRSLVLSLFLIMASIAASAQSRGELINLELIASWTPDDQKSYMQEQLGTDLPIDEGLVNTILDVLSNGVYAYDVNIYKVRYWTVDLAGNAVQATGAMTIPQNDHGKTMILFGRGHVYDESDVFSNLRSGGGSNLFATAYSMIDFIVMVPDYIGCGDGEGREKGFNHIEGANAMVDMYRAGLQVTASLEVKRNGQVLVGGYSQGGGNAMATIRYLQETGLLWNELPVHSAIFGGGPYDFSNTTLNYSLAIEESIDPEYYFMFIRGADDAGYDIYDDPHDQLNPVYWDEWDYYIAHDAIRKENIPTRWKEMFLPEAIEAFSSPDSPLFDYAREQDVYDWRNHISIQMTYGTADTEVPYENAIIARDAIRNQVPWYNFWQKWIVNATDLGAVDHRTAGAYTLLTTLVEFGLHRNAHNAVNLSNYINGAARTGQEVPEPLLTTNRSLMHPALRINNGANTGGRQTVSEVKAVPITPAGAGKAIILTGDVLDMTAVEPGLYVIEATVDGKRKTELYIRKEYELITADDHIDGYFPLQQKDGTWSLDLTYLDNAIEVNLFDQKKQPVSSFPVADEKEISFAGLPKGIYTVEVLTGERAFYLELGNTDSKLSSNTIIQTSGMNKILVSPPDPAVTVSTIQVIDLQGKVIQRISNPGAGPVSALIPAQPGIYIVRVALSDNSIVSKKIAVK